MSRAVDPFSTAPDPDAYVPRQATEEALAELASYLRVGATHIAVRGPAGIGKTLLLRVIGARLEAHYRVVHVPYPVLSPEDIGAWILGLMGEETATNPERTLVTFARELRENGSGLLILVDDAGSMPLPTVRRLSRLATEAVPGLRLIFGVADDSRGDELIAAAGPSIEVVPIMDSMDADECRDYVEARLARAGVGNRVRAAFDNSVMESIFTNSEGLPILANQSALQWMQRIESRLVREGVLDSEESHPSRETVQAGLGSALLGPSGSSVRDPWLEPFQGAADSPPEDRARTEPPGNQRTAVDSGATRSATSSAGSAGPVSREQTLDEPTTEPLGQPRTRGPAVGNRTDTVKPDPSEAPTIFGGARAGRGGRATPIPTRNTSRTTKDPGPGQRPTSRSDLHDPGTRAESGAPRTDPLPRANTPTKRPGTVSGDQATDRGLDGRAKSRRAASRAGGGAHRGKQTSTAERSGVTPVRRPNERVRATVDHALAARLERRRKWRFVRWMAMGLVLVLAFYAGRLSMPLFEAVTPSVATPLRTEGPAFGELQPSQEAPSPRLAGEAGGAPEDAAAATARDVARTARRDFDAALGAMPSVSAGPAGSAGSGGASGASDLVPAADPPAIAAVPRPNVVPRAGTASPATGAITDALASERGAAEAAAEGLEPRTGVGAGESGSGAATLSSGVSGSSGSAEGDAPRAIEPLTVSVNAQPWATIEIDGELLGVTPLAGVPLEPGTHTFRATLPDGRVIVRTERVDSLNRRILFH